MTSLNRGVKISPVTKLTLDFALEQQRQLKRDIDRREKIIRYRYPLYSDWRDANGESGKDSGEDFFSAAVKSGAFRSYEWLSMYMAIARLNVWGKIASLLCEEKYGEHDFTTEAELSGKECGPICKRCGIPW